MRFLLPLSVCVAVLAGCAAESDTSTSHAPKKGASTAPVGAGDTNGEHGTAPPAGDTTAPDPGTEIGDETWADGKKIDTSVTIKAGATVTIAPGATVTVAANATVSIAGTLSVASTATHAKITGASWDGLVVASGGTLTTDGLDITGAKSALWTRSGNAAATVTNTVITADSPFKMETGSKLTISHATVTGTSGSAIAGTFIASNMTYNKGAGAGITLNDPAGTMKISDSILKGSGDNSDYVISNAGAELTLEYTTISGAHCGLHFDAIDKFTIDHVSDDTNAYGAMLYGSGAGPHTISSSNFRSISVDLDMQNKNGPLTLTKVYTPVDPVKKTRKNTLDPTTIANFSTTEIANAKPRTPAQ